MHFFIQLCVTVSSCKFYDNLSMQLFSDVNRRFLQSFIIPCQSVIGLCCSYYLFVNLFAPMATNYSVKFFSGDTSQKFPRIQKVSKRRGRQVIGVKFETFSTSFTQGNVFPVTIHKVTIFFRQH